MKVEDNKEKNITRALDYIKKASEKGTDICVFPEMFNCPYENEKFPIYAETVEEGTTIKEMAKAAKEHSLYLIAGTIPERSGNNLYNSSFIFDRTGTIIGHHRKVHLFDIDIPGKVRFKESDTLESGNEVTIIDTEFGKIGIAICYDIRFAEFMKLMTFKGAQIVFVPAAFNTTTGSAHWKLLNRSRAVDNQVFMVGASPARNTNASYLAYGHSMIVNPWGEIICEANEEETLLHSEIDLSVIDKIRAKLPVLNHIRKDIYTITHINK